MYIYGWNTAEKYGGHYTFDWYTLLFHYTIIFHLRNPFTHVVCTTAHRIFSSAFDDTLSLSFFFYNLKHHINHELSFRVVSEKRYACRRNAPARVFTVRPSAPETAAASILLPPYVLSFEKIGSIFIITKYIFPSRDDVLFSRDTVRFESGSPRGYDSGVKRRRKRKMRKHVHNATAFADVH